MGNSIEYVYSLVDKFSPVLDKMKSDVKKFSEGTEKHMKHAEGSFKLFGINVASILTAHGIMEAGREVFEFGKKCVEAFDEAQVKMVKFKSAVELNAGKVGLSLEELTEIAEKTSKSSIFTSHDIMGNATSKLLMFKHISGETFKIAQEDAMALAIKMGGVKGASENLASASEKLGYMLETGNLGFLKRLKISVDAHTQAQIKAMYASHRGLEGQKLILGLLEKTRKMSNALNETEEAKSIRLQNMKEEIMVKIGKALVPIQNKMNEVFIKILSKAEPYITTLTKGIDKTIQLAIKTWHFLKPILPLIIAITAAFVAYKTIIMVTAIATKAMAVMTGLYETIAIAAMYASEGWAGIQTILNIIMTANPIGVIIVAVGLLIGIIILLVKNWDKVVKFIKDTWNKAVKAFQDGIHKIWKFISDLLNNPIIVALGLIFLPFITIPALIIKHWEKVKKLFNHIRDIIKEIGQFFGIESKDVNINTTNKTVVPPVKGGNNVNVKTENTLNVFKDKGITVVPQKKVGNTQFQMAGSGSSW